MLRSMVAFSSGSSKQGNNFLAWMDSIWVAARRLNMVKNIDIFCQKNFDGKIVAKITWSLRKQGRHKCWGRAHLKCWSKLGQQIRCRAGKADQDLRSCWGWWSKTAPRPRSRWKFVLLQLQDRVGLVWWPGRIWKL